MSLEAGRGKFGVIEDRGTHTRVRTRSGSYWGGRTDVVTITPKEQDPDAPHHVVMPGYTANGKPTVAEDIATRLALGTGGTADVFTVSGLLRGSRLSRQTREEFPDEPVRSNVRRTGRSPLEVNRAAALLRNLREREIEGARVVDHSLGVQSTAIAMDLDNEGRIEDGVSVASAGVNEDRPVKNTIVRFGADSVRETWRVRKDKKARMAMTRLAKAGGSMLVRHPVRFVWHEIRAAKYGNVAQTVVDSNADLKFLSGTTDAVFGDSEFTQDAKLQDHKTRYDGGHNRIFTDPGFVAQEVVPLFAQLKRA